MFLVCTSLFTCFLYGCSRNLFASNDMFNGPALFDPSDAECPKNFKLKYL